MSTNTMKYSDPLASMYILGALLKDPTILDDTVKYRISVDDFTSRLHKIIFSSINNLYINGLYTIGAADIHGYLEKSGVSDHFVSFNKENGLEFIQKCQEIADRDKLDYYYQRSKKLRFLREMGAIGFESERIYDPNEPNFEIREQREKKFQEMTILELSNTVQAELDRVTAGFELIGNEQSVSGGNGIFELLEELSETPALGYPTYDPMLSSIMMGMRLGKYSIMSANSGVGKTRQMAAMAAHLSAGQKYDLELGRWVDLPSKVPTLFIATEQDLSEIQTLWLSYIAQVDEEFILDQRKLSLEERDRVWKAAQILKDSPMELVEMPDFGIRDIEDAIRSAIKEHDVKVCFFDYINTSLKILQEISSIGGNIREDQVLYLLSTKLKELATSYGVSIMTATQTNRSAHDSSEASSAMLKGSSAIIEKADFGAIMMKLTEKDKEMLQPLMAASGAMAEPNMIISIFKNRRGKHSTGKLWVRAELGMCDFKGLFYTDHDYNIHQINAFDIEYLDN